ncbi:uncharacterized protein JCM10292_003589 [Rhodotorula paludigena]|uniref:uncharacterized protein n=1 Tax=Rhodotorula paludigena TaxID=86838 RepID=UPI003177D0AC
MSFDDRFDDRFDRFGDDNYGLHGRDRILVIVLPTVGGVLLLLILLWIFWRLRAIRRRVLACEERELVHDTAIAAVKEERELERERWFSDGWRHGKRHEKRKYGHHGHHGGGYPIPLPVPVPYYPHHHRRHHHYPPYGPPYYDGVKAIGY